VREFDKPIGRVWRRLRLQRFLAALIWCWGACLALTAAAIAAEKLTHRPLPGADWWPFAIAGGVGLVVAALFALLTGPSRVDAAVAIDRAFGLNERLSTALTLPEDLRETAAGRALIADTIRHVDRLDVGAKFGLRLPRRAWVPLVPGALAVGLLFVPEWSQKTAKAGGKAAEPLNKEAAAKINKALSKSIAQQREKLDKNAFAETEKLLAEIEKAAEKLSKSPPAEKDKAMVEYNKLTDALKERQKQLGDTQQIGKQLQQLKEMSAGGPADQFAKDLARGDFQKAAQEVKKLQEQLASGKMSEADKKALQEQLGEMKQQLEKLANLEERKKQLDQAYKNGGLTKEQYEQQMAKLNDQAKDLQKLQQLAQKLAQAQQGLQKGDMKKAADALGMSQQQLQEMAKAAQEIESIDQALADIQDAKNGMNGEGMNQLGEGLDGANQLGMGERMGNGNGLGRGRGRGDRPEIPDDVASYNTKVKQQYGKGKAVLEGFAPPSKQIAGDSVITVQEAIESAPGLAAEALSNQKVPKNVEKHVLGYFDQIRKGN
jgi:hypothetical protein